MIITDDIRRQVVSYAKGYLPADLYADYCKAAHTLTDPDVLFGTTVGLYYYPDEQTRLFFCLLDAICKHINLATRLREEVRSIEQVGDARLAALFVNHADNGVTLQFWKEKCALFLESPEDAKGRYGLPTPVVQNVRQYLRAFSESG